MRISQSICILLSLSWAARHADAATLQLRDATGKVITGATIQHVWENNEPPGIVTVEKPVTVHNTGSRAVSVGVKKIEFGELQADVYHSLCYAGVCFTPEVFVSPFFETIPAGKSDSGLESAFKGSYSFETTEHRPSIDRVAYIFFDEKNPADSSIVFVEYNTMALASNAIAPLQSRRPFLSRYSTAQGGVLFSLPFPEGGSESLSFGLVGMSGKKLPLSKISRMGGRGDISVETPRLNPGIYCLSVFAGRRLLGVERFTVVR